MIKFSPINTNAKYYPKPLIPVLPAANFSSFTLVDNKNSESPFFQQGVFYSNARSALANALILSNVNKDCAVLLPAYHCGSMIEPAMWLKANILLYKVNKDLTPNLNDIEYQIINSKKNVSAMLLPHYFGFLQDASYWRKFCEQHNIILIEDCAHAFFGLFNDNSFVGTKGHFAIASVRKFFCTPDGGILISQNLKKNALPFQKQSFMAQIRSLLLLLQYSTHYKRLNISSFLFSSIKKTPPPHLLAITPNSDIIPAKIPTEHNHSQWKWFNPALSNLKGSFFSHWLMKHSNLKQIISCRKKNYLTILNGIKNIQHLKPLFKTLPTNTIPYMFPVLLTSGEKDFDKLKRKGLPIWRWEELAKSNCTISQHYQFHLLHLPCHQELKSHEISWMLNLLRQSLGEKK